MATTTISALTAGTALAGTEVAPFDQGASTVKITATQIKTWTSASPTLVTPALGTPSSGTLTSCTGLPAAGVVGTAAILGANTFTALQTITQASANAGILASTGYSLTGSNATSMVDLAGTWNTSGTPSLIKVALTLTAYNAASKVIDIQDGSAANLLSFGPKLINSGGAGLLIGPTGASANGVYIGGYPLTADFGVWGSVTAPTNTNYVLYSRDNVYTALSTRNSSGTVYLMLADTPKVTVTSSAMTLADAVNVPVGTSTGTKIGTATSQKLGFWNATPVVQQVLATGGGATVDNVITLLQTLGLCKQS